MANSQLYQKRWKYVSIGLMAILALGFSFPQALGDITGNVNHMLTHIYNFTDGIEAKTNNLPADPASQSAVEGKMFNQIIRENESGLEDVSYTATSSENFIIHVCVSVGSHPSTGNFRLEVIDLSTGSVVSRFVFDDEHEGCFTFGNEGGDGNGFLVTISVEEPGSTAAFSYVTLMTNAGATASIEKVVS